MNNFRESGIRTLEIEIDSLTLMKTRLDEQFDQACAAIMACKGRVIVTGMGKSGHIGKKIAATLASTGTPSFFVHPAEAGHGDMGMITDTDAVIAISNSGESDELNVILPLIKRLGLPLIAMTGKRQSTLGSLADYCLDTGVEQEACPLGLAPTASTTNTLAMGDALAVALLEAKGFTKDEYAFSHPLGALGKRLLLKVDHLMHSGEQIPQIPETASLKEALLEMTKKGLGLTTVIDEQGKLCGIYTDGDLRRTLDEHDDLRGLSISQVMHSQPKTIDSHALAAEALHVMESNKITSLVVIEDGRLKGIIHLHDILNAGLA